MAHDTYCAVVWRGHHTPQLYYPTRNQEKKNNNNNPNSIVAWLSACHTIPIIGHMEIFRLKEWWLSSSSIVIISVLSAPHRSSQWQFCQHFRLITGEQRCTTLVCILPRQPSVYCTFNSNVTFHRELRKASESCSLTKCLITAKSDYEWAPHTPIYFRSFYDRIQL